MRNPYLHPKDTEIRALIAEGKNNYAIARELHADRAAVRRIRKLTGTPNPSPQLPTLEEKWAARTRPVEGGHMEWRGERVGPAGSPVMRYKEASYSPTAIAFEMRHGRPPQGYAIADCGLPQCVAPDHVDDEAGRLAKRTERRRAGGLDDRPDTCANGHDQSTNGRLQRDGRPYCEACKRAWKTDPEAARDARAAARAAVRRDIETMLRQDIPQTHIAAQLHVGTATVQRTRRQLGLSAPRSGPRARYSSLEEAFRANTAPGDGDHLRWTGTVDSGRGTPYVRLNRQKVPAARVSFELHHGRPPAGQVRADGCTVDGCLAGAHLTDQLTRQARRHAEQLKRAADRRADKAFAAIFGAVS